MSAVLNEIVVKLQNFIKKYYVNELIKGSLLFLSIGLLYFLSVLVLENFFWLSPSGRRILFWTFIIIEAGLLVKFIGIPLAKLLRLSSQISNKEASRIIGNHFPDVDDQLINLLELSEKNEKSDLLQASIEQKSKQLSPVPFQLAINFKKSLSYAKYAVIPLFVFAVFTIFNGRDWYQNSFKRVVNYNTAYEPPAPFYFKLLNENLSVIQSKDYKISVTTYGSIVPNQISINFNNETYFLKKEDYNQFSYTFTKPTENVEFTLKSGDQNSRAYVLNVNEAPSILSFRMKVVPPAHVKQQTEIYDNSGNAVIAEGSKVSWQVASKNAEKVSFSVDSLRKQFKKDGANFSFASQIKNPTDYSIASSNKFVTDFEKLNFTLDVIRDKKPSIAVQGKVDSTDVTNTFFYGQLADDYGLRKLQIVYYKYNEQKNLSTKEITITKDVFADFVYQFPGDLNLKEATTYAFYFEVFDNDGFNGSKSARSETFNYRKLSTIENEQRTSKTEQQRMDQFSNTLDEFEKSEMDLESFSKLQKQQSSLSFKEKQKLDDLLSKKAKQQKSLKKLSEQLDKTIDKLNKDENSEAIKEQLERTKKKLEENQKLIDEIKKMLEKLSPEQLQKKVDELQKNSKKLTKNLNQVLELTKRYYVIDKHQRVAQMLELLSEKQAEAATKTDNNQKEQENINKEWDIVQDELNELRKSNNALKDPMQLDDDPANEEKINTELNDALKDLKKGKMDPAKIKQKIAATMMKNLADKMQMESASGGGMEMDQIEEDADMLRQILDNLVLFSLNQEDNMNSFKGINANNPSYSGYVRRQQVLREHFNHVDDSLYALSSRNPQIGTTVNDLISDIDYDLDAGVAKLTDNNTNRGLVNLQYAVSHSNDLALMLSESLGLLNEQMKPGKKGSKGNKSKGFQLPDIIKKQESLNNAMQQMLEGGEKKPGESSKEEAGGQQKPGDKGKSGEEGKEGQEGKKGEAGNQGEQGKTGQNGQSGTGNEAGNNRQPSQSGKGGQSGESGKDGDGQSGQKRENARPGSNGEKGGKAGDKNGKGKEGEKDDSGNKSEGGEDEYGEDGKAGVKGKGKKGKGEGENGGTGDGEGKAFEEESDYGELFEIYKQQQDLRNQLENRLAEEGIAPDEKRVLQQMEQVENELLEKGFNEETLNRMLNLKHQLFKLNKAQFQQGKDANRKSETNIKELPAEEIITEEQIKQYFNTTEILNRQALPLQPEYKKKVQAYFIKND